MHRTLIRLASVALLSTTITTVANAQNGQARRSSGNPPPGGEEAPLTLPRVPYDPSHPFAGVWQGTLKTAFGEAPYTVVIEFVNDVYTGYSSPGTPPRGAAPHLRNTLAGKNLRWEQDNMGGNGVLIFTAEVIDLNSIKGVMTTRDVKWPAGSPDPGGSFTLKRRLPAK